ncbi:MAG: KH domain-containing protein [Chloroflexi bacterium AL-W]|nr:KH domain-containing protein [Chloroflexi bacterium AL-N1]NOK64584.1 KH domain-containing protein [Chloroflexi bacterium AL-N10]NOK75826.1 KH domain-containing protein [Chloroflexi bacterium AL-N5]NOK80415.1 KH domain-containing protein [Chloroflexi bacterium AL-W]NOK86929.1 KH domain-containing protein [Chloroflexi bacterium AL-N15]
MKSIEISARTVAEAIQLALDQLGKDRDEVAIEVLEAGSEDEEALVRVTAIEDEEPNTQQQRPAADWSELDQISRRVLEDLLEAMDTHGYVTAVRSSVPGQHGDTEETLTLHVEGADEEAMGLLIGRRGETLRSLQFMVNLLVSRKVQKWPQIVVDVGNYRQRRQESLEGLARRMAERVRQGGRSIALEPMGAYERRIVHLALRSDNSVYTQSAGEGDTRKVIIYPAKS